MAALLLVMFTLFFCATGNSLDAATSTISVAKTYSYQGPDEIAQVVVNNSATDIHLLYRGKIKAKIFLKKSLTPVRYFLQRHFVDASTYFTSPVCKALKPGYYGFLFRYKPF